MRAALVTLCLAVAAPVRCWLVTDARDVYSLIENVVVDVLQAWDVVGPALSPENVKPPFLQKKEKRLMDRITEVSKRMELVDRQVHGASVAAMDSLQQDLPFMVRYELKLETLSEWIGALDAAHATMQEYARTRDVRTRLGLDHRRNSTEPEGTTSPEPMLERHTLESFATYAVSHDPSSVRGLLNAIHYAVVPSDDVRRLVDGRGIFALVRTAVHEAKNTLCSVHQSPQQLLYNLYASIQLTQLKGYTMMQFSWMLLRLYGKGNFTLEAEMMRERYLERMLQQADAIKEAMSVADQSMWRCDPRDHVEGETYTQLTRLLQGYVQNEVDMNAQQSCKESCGYYSYAKQHGCFKNNFCARQAGCGGDIVDCRYIDSDMYICQADPMSNRRYEWIEYENGRVLGVQSQCSRGKTKVDSWWRWLFWHCSFCFCLCDDPHRSDRYFNLRPTVSDIANNRVVTGVQFVKHNRVIHIKIQEAELLPKGAINESTLLWRPADNYQITDNHVRSGADFHKMSWGERAIDLDDLIAPTNHIVTGVRFRKVGTHLNMEIRATPFNFTSGQLLKPQDKSLWLSNDNTDGALVTPRTLLELESPDVPTRTPIPSKPDSHSDQYLQFTYSDIDLDAAQTTVPFVDIQPVAPQPSTPLAGLGLYHKGQRWFGGFVAPKVFTYDFGRHIRDNFPQINEAIQIKK